MDHKVQNIDYLVWGIKYLGLSLIAPVAAALMYWRPELLPFPWSDISSIGGRLTLYALILPYVNLFIAFIGWALTGFRLTSSSYFEVLAFGLSWLLPVLLGYLSTFRMVRAFQYHRSGTSILLKDMFLVSACDCVFAEKNILRCVWCVLQIIHFHL